MNQLINSIEEYLVIIDIIDEYPDISEEEFEREFNKRMKKYNTSVPNKL